MNQFVSRLILVKFINMKKVNLFFLIFSTLFVLESCGNIEDLNLTDQINDEESTHLSQYINQNEAQEIANIVLKHNATKAEDPLIEYVLNSGTHTRSYEALPDTLAYIINYPDNKGFVIVSGDRRVYPVLGFSYEGNFNTTNEIAETNFIDNIENYLIQADEETLFDINDGYFDSCYELPPKVQISLSQGDPWDKYVIKDHPGCPVGCVAVATGLVMSHCKFILDYNGITYYLQPMIQAIKNGSTTNTNNPSQTQDLKPTNPPKYTYTQAVDYMARILYQIGLDVNMTYSIGSSSANSVNAYNLCRSLGYEIPSGYATYNIEDITEYLKDGHIIYLKGTNINNNNGHAWVVDGCNYCVDSKDETKILDSYLHCDWGWGGTGNGYFSGSVFNVNNRSYKPMNYFAVKIE